MPPHVVHILLFGRGSPEGEIGNTGIEGWLGRKLEFARFEISGRGRMDAVVVIPGSR